MAKGHTSFDGMTWPVPGARLDDVEAALRDGTAERHDVLYAASVLAAYRALVGKPRRARDSAVQGIRRAVKP